MVWVRLADDFTDHPKVVAAGPLAGWLYVCGLTYSNRYLTDGFVPSGQVRRMADVDNANELAERLVKVGLWEVVEDGYRIHDYHGYQPSADDVKREREETARRQADYRARKRNGSSNGVTNGERSGAPYPARPVPGPGNPVPSGSTPLPPPQAEGAGAADAAEGKRRRGRRNGSSHDEPTAEPLQEPGVAPVTTSDREVLNRALAAIRSKHDTPAWRSNVEQIGLLEPLGRAADGGMHLRAPPGLGLGKFKQHVARALLDAGDEHAAQVAIVEGRPGESKG